MKLKRLLLCLVCAAILLTGVVAAAPTAQAASKTTYQLVVDTSKQRVYAYSKDSKGNYTKLVRSMICSTGKNSTPTPKGNYSISDKYRWYYFTKFNCWAQYTCRFRGPYLMHSVLYSKKDTSTLSQSSVRNLGSKASHGCVRMKVSDAQWIYSNCPSGTKVRVK